MPTDPHELAEWLVALCRALRHVPRDDLASAIDIAEDILSEDDDHTSADETRLSGLRWGHHAADHVARQRNVLIHAFLPEGGLTWHLPDAASKDTQSRIGQISSILIAKAGVTS